MTDLKETDKTRLGRAKQRAVFDRNVLYQILDEAILVNVGFSMDGQPFVMPTLGWRAGNTLYIHGSIKAA